MKPDIKAIKLPRDFEFHEDIRLSIWRPHGLLNEAVINKVVLALRNLEAAMVRPFNRFADTLAARKVHLNYKHIVHVSLYRHLSYLGRRPVKSAILATDSTIIHYARLHAIVGGQRSSLIVRIFQDRKEVAEWLGVPIERLMVEAPATTQGAVERPDYSPRLSQRNIQDLKALVAAMPRLPQTVYRIDSEKPDAAVVHTGRWRDLGDVSFWFTAKKTKGKWHRVSEIEYDHLKPDQIIPID